MLDSITEIGKSIVHHGKSNNRIYLMSLDDSDLPNIIKKLDDLANENRYTKIIAKVPKYASELFEGSGYVNEAIIPEFYNGKEDAYFLSKYLDENRITDTFENYCNQVYEWAKSKDMGQDMKPFGESFSCRVVTDKDLDDMVLVYQETFKTYPFPIHDKSYLLKTMNENVIYFGIWIKGELVAVSSIEAAKGYSNAELTDFATLKAYRGQGYASYLLAEMEKTMKELGFHTAYTIARAKSYGMNITFSKKGYQYAGRLINNTNISGNIESMNVWYKILR
ncbi:MAG: Acetyltransferase family protein [Clostridiales bacterium]|jgi:lysine 2,3-aminomutase|nr:Acetyltransferase family protein [Clostridiales bacterium]